MKCKGLPNVGLHVGADVGLHVGADVGMHVGADVGTTFDINSY